MKTALVTGANRGLGLEISKQLAERGYHVLLGCRTLEKSAATAGALAERNLSVEAIEIDVVNSASVGAAFQTVKDKHPALDVLVNNAGVLLDYGTAISELSVENLRESFETNFFGAFLTTQTFLPLLKASAAGRKESHRSIHKDDIQ